MAQLVDDRSRVYSQRDENRRIGVAKLMRRQADRKRWLRDLDQMLVCAGHGACQDAVADVAGVLPASGERRKDEILGLEPRLARLVCREVVAQLRQQLDRPPSSVRLRLAHEDAVAGEIDVTPAQRRQLTDPQTGKDERGEDRPSPQLPIRSCVGIKLSGGGEQCIDLFGAVEPTGAGLVTRSRRRRPTAGFCSR
jgi:hypothetical protein